MCLHGIREFASLFHAFPRIHIYTEKKEKKKTELGRMATSCVNVNKIFIKINVIQRTRSVLLDITSFFNENI